MSETGTTLQSQSNTTQRRLLVAVSEHKEHMLGLQFLSSFFHSRDNISIELFFLLPPKHTTKRGPYGTIMGKGQMDEEIFKLHLERGKQAVQEAKGRLLESGFAGHHIVEKLKRPEDAMHWNMLEEVKQGQFEAIVLGNRGRSWLERVLEGDADLGEELLHTSCPTPLWICAEPRPEAKDVLLCLDGSEMSWRMARHVAQMARHEHKQRVVMLRVKRDNPAGKETPESLFAKGSELLREAGFAEERIASRVVENNDVTQAILQEAETGNYAVVATGRHGAGTSLLRNEFMGSVTEKLFRKMRQGALWVQC